MISHAHAEERLEEPAYYLLRSLHCLRIRPFVYATVISFPDDSFTHAITKLRNTEWKILLSLLLAAEKSNFIVFTACDQCWSPGVMRQPANGGKMAYSNKPKVNLLSE